MAGYPMRSFSGSRDSRRSRFGDDCSFQYGNYHVTLNIFMCFFLQLDCIFLASSGSVFRHYSRHKFGAFIQHVRNKYELRAHHMSRMSSSTALALELQRTDTQPALNICLLSRVNILKDGALTIVF